MRKGWFTAAAMALALSALALSGCKGKNAGKEAPEAVTDAIEAGADNAGYRDDFAGAWTDRDTGAMLDIWKSEDGVFHAMACVKTSETEVSYWTFTAPAENGKMEYTDCERIDAIYGSNGQISETTVYERGRGNVEFDGESLVWHDATDNAGEGLRFEYEGGY